MKHVIDKPEAKSQSKVHARGQIIRKGKENLASGCHAPRSPKLYKVPLSVRKVSQVKVESVGIEHRVVLYVQVEHYKDNLNEPELYRPQSIEKVLSP